jgi:septin family protein
MDERIHLVFYFLTPHHIRPIDKEFLLSLNNFVNIVPIISKSDCMTMEERKHYLMEIREFLKNLQVNNHIKIYDFLEETDDFLPDYGSDLATAYLNSAATTDNTGGSGIASLASPSNSACTEYGQRQHVKSPCSSSNDSYDHEEILVEENLGFSSSLLRSNRFAGTSSSSHHLENSCRTDDNAIIAKIPNVFAISCDSSGYRHYPWGTIETENPKHSDFSRLQTLIFEKGNINKFRNFTQGMTSKLYFKKKHEKKERFKFFLSLIALIVMILSIGIKNSRMLESNNSAVHGNKITLKK